MDFEFVKKTFIKMLLNEIDETEFFQTVKSEFSKEGLYLLIEGYHYKSIRCAKGTGEYSEFDGDVEKEIIKLYTEMMNRTYDFVFNPCVYLSPTSPNKHICHKECDECIGKRHWLGIINNRPNHFVDDENNVYYITDVHNSGFGGRTFNVELENGKRFKCGLWYNGECTDYIANQIPKGKIIREGD